MGGTGFKMSIGGLNMIGVGGSGLKMSGSGWEWVGVVGSVCECL